MSLVFEKVSEEEEDDMVFRVVLNGKPKGVVWRQKSRVFDSYGRPTPRFNNRWFARLEGADEDEIIGKGIARASSRKGDGYFDRFHAVEALLKSENQDTNASPQA